jgi:protein-tyrosine phosphatase
MRIAVVCLGNICRSPMAQVVLEQRVREAGIAVEVVSAGTGDYHLGGPMDRRAATTLTAAGYDPTGHRAQQFAADWFARFDLVLAMDRENLEHLRSLAGPYADRLHLFRDFDPAGQGDVPDPYHGRDDGFRDVLATIERTADALVDELVARVGR